MIKNIIFDIGGVIWKGNHSSILDKLNLSLKEKDEIEKVYFKPWLKVDLGKETINERFSSCKFSFKINNDIKDKIINFYKYREFNYDVINLINKLKEKGFNIYILSNNNKEAINYLKGLDILKNIDGWIVSCDTHLMKPSEEIYKALLNKFNLNPHECYFIDDKEKNINAAKKLGIDGYIFKNTDDLINDMIDKKIIKN